MRALLVGYLISLGTALVILMIRDYRRGRVDLLSVRNFFLVGFIIFQIISPVFFLITLSAPAGVSIHAPVRAGAQFALMATVFLIAYLFVYSRGWGMQRLATKMPRPAVVQGDVSIAVLAVVVVAIAGLWKFGFLIPVVYELASRIGEGTAAVAMGLAGVAMMRRKLNPAMFVLMIAVLLADVGITLMWSKSRRPIIGVFLALLWAIYYFNWRGQSFPRLSLKLVALAILPLLFLGAYSTTRYAVRERTPVEHIKQLSQANVTGGTLGMFRGADCGAVSFWLIEKFPERFDYRHLHTFKYFFIYPIPRSIWPDKPTVMAQDFARLATQRGVPLDQFSVGPGVVGSAACEGGWYALFVYALWMGLFCRFFDQLVIQNPHNILAVCAVGSGLGHILALPRGETGSFAATYVLLFAGTWITVLIVGWVARNFGMATSAHEIPWIPPPTSAPSATG